MSDPAADPNEAEMVSITVRHTGGDTTLRARRGRILREVLLSAATEDTSGESPDHAGESDLDLSPYTRLTARANCGGRGLCATCGVRLLEGPAPDHWHDRLAARFGYPRLSCQIRIEDGMIVELDEEKVVWGRRVPES